MVNSERVDNWFVGFFILKILSLEVIGFLDGCGMSQRSLRLVATKHRQSPGRHPGVDDPPGVSDVTQLLQVRLAERAAREHGDALMQADRVREAGKELGQA